MPLRCWRTSLRASSPRHRMVAMSPLRTRGSSKARQAYYLEHGGDVLGTVFKPWAVDAAGNSVPTSYSWDNGALTQHVDLSVPGIEFPVVADPAWGYTYYYGLNKVVSCCRSRSVLGRSR